MNHVRKMTLMPADMAERLLYEQRHKQDTNPVANYVMDIDKQMQNLLATRNVSEYDKAVNYMQLLRKYLDVLHDDPVKSHAYRETAPIVPTPDQATPPSRSSSEDVPSMLEREEEPKTSVQPSFDSIVNNVPQYARGRAKKLLAVLEQDPYFDWNKK